MRESDTQRRIFLRLFVPFAVILAATVLAAHWLDRALERRAVAAQAASDIRLAEGAITRDFADALSDALVLADSPALQSHLFTGDAESLDHLAVEFANLARHKRRYAQIRYLDWDGREALRLDYERGALRFASQDQLQDKSHRYYVQLARGLPRDSVYISRLDSNREHGAIEQPAEPTLRFVAPVYDRDSVPRGLIVLNYRARQFISRVQRQARLSRHDLSIVNERGDWLVGPLPASPWREASGQLDRFPDRYPEIWRSIESGERGQHFTAEGLITYAIVHPDHRLHPGGDGPPGAVVAEESWKILSLVPTSALVAQPDQRLRIAAPLAAAFALAWAILSLRLARVRASADAAERRVQQYSGVLAQTNDIVVITDADGVISYTNPAFTRVTGFAAEEVLGRTPSMLRSGHHSPALYHRLWETILEGKLYQGVFVNRTKDGALYYEEKTITPVRDASGAITHFVSTGKDITELIQTQEHLSRLTYLAHHDPLTGLPNRSLFLDRLQHAMDQAERQQRLAALLFIDLDGFKAVNDRYGHKAGDHLLQVLATRLTGVVRKVDTVARLGGDEFTIVLERLSYVADAERVAQKVLAELEHPFVVDEQHIAVTASIGIVFHPFDSVDRERLLMMADAAMYQSKQLGRNRFCVYSPEAETEGNASRHSVAG